MKVQAFLIRVYCAASLSLAGVASGCNSSSLQDRSALQDSTVAVLMKASIPLVTANIRYGQLIADSLHVLSDGTTFTGFNVQLLLGEGSDTTIVHALQARVGISSGEVDLVGVRFRTSAGRQITADRGKYDGRTSIQLTARMRIDDRLIEPLPPAVKYRVDTGELVGCGAGCG